MLFLLQPQACVLCFLPVQFRVLNELIVQRFKHVSFSLRVCSLLLRLLQLLLQVALLGLQGLYLCLAAVLWLPQALCFLHSCFHLLPSFPPHRLHLLLVILPLALQLAHQQVVVLRRNRIKLGRQHGFLLVLVSLAVLLIRPACTRAYSTPLAPVPRIPGVRHFHQLAISHLLHKPMHVAIANIIPHPPRLLLQGKTMARLSKVRHCMTAAVAAAARAQWS